MESPALRPSGFFRTRFAARALLVGALLAAASSGCASVRYGVGERPYNPWFAQTNASRAVTFRAVKSVIEQDHAADLETSEQDFRLTAIVNLDSDTRDRVTVEVHERGEIMISFRTELLDSGEWNTASGVCSSYDSAREQALAQRILDYASAGMSDLAMASRARSVAIQ